MNLQKQVDLLMRGSEFGDDDLKQAMADELLERLREAKRENRPLRVYCGYDPTSTDLHLGHTITMRKLRQFQDFGHHVIFLIGDYTSLVGDPSDKDKLRPILSPEQVQQNAKTYAEQAFKVLDKNKTEILFNSEWLSKLTFVELIHIASNFTVQQFINRENFKKRWEKGDPVFLHETFYAIMQAYDAFAMKADVQVGGSDQLFNIITAGRKLMVALGEKPNIGIIMGILPGTDGEIRMSKTLGNHIPINDDAADMFGKVMSVPDKAMKEYANLATRWHPDEITAFLDGIENGIFHPRDAKMKLAKEITEIFYGPEEAELAKGAFIRIFQEGNLPKEMPIYLLKKGQSVLDVLEINNLINSRGDGRRLIKQNGVKIDGEVVSDPNLVLEKAGILQVGKRRYLRLELENE